MGVLLLKRHRAGAHAEHLALSSQDWRLEVRQLAFRVLTWDRRRGGEK
jgi:hypothetical protein